VGARVTLREVGLSASAVLGAWTAAVSQPLLDLYGKNVTLFTAAKLDPWRIVAFSAVIALAAPLAWLAVALALRRAPRLFRGWRALSIGVGAALVALVFLNARGVRGAVLVPSAVALAILGAVLFERSRGVRSVVALMGLLAPVVLVLFLGTSSVAHFAWSASGSDVALAPGSVPHRPTIVWLVFDETNLAMLLDPSGHIDATRYPHLAALAGESTWYRNAVGVDSQTPRAVPGLLSGRDGSGTAWPTSADYPVNAFSLLAATYRIDAYEPVTDLCVSKACLANQLTGSRRLRSFLRDAAIVYGTMALPPTLAAHLPRVTDAWGGFGSESPASSATRPTMAKFRRFNRGPAQQVDVAAGFTARIVRAERPTLHFLHLLLPHRPWRLLPDGSAYDDAESESLPRYREPKDLWLAQDQAARFALQAAAMDAVLGRIVARLRAEGLWTTTFLALSADHGIVFTPGAATRFPEAPGSLDELYRVPMLVHAPGQLTGGVSDSPVSTADILPTLLGVLGAPPLAATVGIDLAGAVPAGRVRLGFSKGVGHALDSTATTVATRRATYASWFPGLGAGWEPIFGRGPYRGLLGQVVPATAGTAVGFHLRAVLPASQGGGGDGPSIGLVVARLATPGRRPVPDGAIVVASAGRIVGFLGGAAGTSRSDPTLRLEGVVDWRKATGDLAYYLARGPASAPTLERIGA
jgi:hypothetical protein